ncbi:MAG: type IV pilus assembly protein PilM [Syntrophobacteraceae bacterium]|nr:type IV pilus assembly protein PilM [Syntrophobacteraceae bacterium]
MISLFSKSENLVGLDIGSHSVKLLELQSSNDALRLVNMGVAPLQRESFVEGRLTKPEVVAETIRMLASHLKVKRKSVAVSISGYDVMIKKIELPTMTEDELAARMQSELGQYIPYNIDEVDVDYQVVDASKDRPNFMDVLLVAAKKESVTDFNNLLKLAGFDPLVVDVDFFALSNSFEATFGFGDERVALLDMGANKTLLNIAHKGVPIFTRSISVGGNQLTEAIKDNFHISFEEAEAVKLGESEHKYPTKDLEEIFVSTVSGWVTQCQRALDFYFHNFPDDKISSVYLSGGCCQIPGLDKVFREHLDIPVEIFNPVARIHHDSKQIDPAYVEYVGPQMAISFGLALRKNREK